MRLLSMFAVTALLLFAAPRPHARGADSSPPKDLRGFVTRARGPVSIDGRLAEWSGAFCTPVHYSHGRLEDRAAQIIWMWDETNLYVGIRALDRHRGHGGGPVWNGDAVEFYLDARPAGALRGKDWTTGSIHLFYTPFEGKAVKPHWEMRGAIATSGDVPKGFELAATEADWGYESEMAIPWANFPAFAPTVGSVLAVDVELCSGEGAGRTDRTFAYGSPLSVQQPASFGPVELVDSSDASNLPAGVAASTFPMWVETPWTQPERATNRAVVAISPAFAAEVGSVEVRLHDAEGRVVETLPAPVARFGPDGSGFARAVASWPIDRMAPWTYFATASIKSKSGKTLATVAPRMVLEGDISGR